MEWGGGVEGGGGGDGAGETARVWGIEGTYWQMLHLTGIFKHQ